MDIKSRWNERWFSDLIPFKGIGVCFIVSSFHFFLNFVLESKVYSNNHTSRSDCETK